MKLNEDIICMPLKKARMVFEKEYFSQVIERSITMTDAARRVGMERTAFHRKLNHLGVRVERINNEGE